MDKNINWKPRKARTGKILTIGCIALIGITMIPIFVHPYLYPDYWQKKQKEGRRGIDQEKIQPPGMRVWSNPFEPRKDK